MKVNRHEDASINPNTFRIVALRNLIFNNADKKIIMNEPCILANKKNLIQRDRILSFSLCYLFSLEILNFYSIS